MTQRKIVYYSCTNFLPYCTLHSVDRLSLGIRRPSAPSRWTSHAKATSCFPSRLTQWDVPISTLRFRFPQPVAGCNWMNHALTPCMPHCSGSSDRIQQFDKFGWDSHCQDSSRFDSPSNEKFLCLFSDDTVSWVSSPELAFPESDVECLQDGDPIWFVGPVV